jgi:ubiquinone/menaquinone biosynthesis C-methylase UbiE
MPEFSMSKLHDREYLLNDQYRDAEKLNARIRLHQGFSTNPCGWFNWVFDQYHLSEGCQVLELGCGPGDLWCENIDRIPPGWGITLSDFSEGMLAQARDKLSGLSHPFAFKTIDAQAIPFEEARFDAVIANHCLYHIPDRSKALSEVHRVLKPGGQFFATTIGLNHLRDWTELVARFNPAVEDGFSNEANPFTLENGEAQVSAWFTDVKIQRYPDALQVTEVVPLVDFLFSSLRLGLDESQREAFAAFVEAEMASQGGIIHIRKDSGMFTARKP